MLDDMIEDVAVSEMRAEIQDHLRCCEHCEVTLNTTRRTIEIYRQHAHEIYEMPDDLRERLHKSVMKAFMARCKKSC